MNSAEPPTTLTMDALLSELVPDLLRYFLSRLDDREDAADAVADTLLVLWKKRRAVPQEPEDTRRYAFGIARNVLSSWRRGGRRRNALADRLRATVQDETVTDASPDIDLRAALRRLSEKDRELVLLVAWDGFTVADAGRIIGVSPDAARARYARARTKLREMLTSAG